MMIAGCDVHPRRQRVAIFDSDSGEIEERKPMHSDGEAERFCAEPARPAPAGVEACGHAQWFPYLPARPGHQAWVGDAASRLAMQRET